MAKLALQSQEGFEVLPAPAPRRRRIESIDFLRGAAMILMALDHAREFVHVNSAVDPTDVSRVGPLVFFTRWVTHFCAPIFVFLAGSGIYLSVKRDDSLPRQSEFLLKRGAWLLLLELTVIHFGFTMSLNYNRMEGQVIWAIGWSMILFSLLVFVPTKIVGIISVLILASHNLMTSVANGLISRSNPIFAVLLNGHKIGVGNGVEFVPRYPLLPWFAVMGIGYAMASIFKEEPARRKKVLFGFGAGMTCLFVGLRMLNVYGDPAPWVSTGDSVRTVMSFLDAEKYPPSLLYVLMTLGPALMALAFFDRPSTAVSRAVSVFGKVPLFFYILHIPLTRVLVAIYDYFRAMPAVVERYPYGEWGYGLPLVYLTGVLVVLLLYPACRWYADFKQRRTDLAWLRYF